MTDKNRIKKLLGSQKQVILAIDGLQPHVGQEVLWVIRDCISETILLARSLLSSRGEDISKMLAEVVEYIPALKGSKKGATSRTISKIEEDFGH